jgi:phosphonate dehydrogenase
MKPKVVITQWVHSEIIEFLSKSCEVVPNSSRAKLAKEEILRRAGDASALMAFMPDCVDGDFLDVCPDLRIVAGALKGYDNLDAAACEARGIWLTIVPDLLTVPTAELTHGLMIALARNLGPSDRYLRAGRFKGWAPRFYGVGLDGSTVGIVGMGAVGQALAQRLLGYEVEVVYHDLRQLPAQTEQRLRTRRVGLNQLLVSSDLVAAVLPLNDGTRHFFNDHTLGLMKRGSYLINTGRGSTVDELAVVRALQRGQLRGYAADVFEFEDWARGDRPRTIPRELVGNTEQTLFTTHIGSAVEKVRFAIAMEAAQSILQALRGETPRGAVNRPCVPATSINARSILRGT